MPVISELTPPSLIETCSKNKKESAIKIAERLNAIDIFFRNLIIAIHEQITNGLAIQMTLENELVIFSQPNNKIAQEGQAPQSPSIQIASNGRHDKNVIMLKNKRTLYIE